MCGSTIFALPEGRYCMAFTDPNSVIEQAARILLPEQNFFISINGKIKVFREILGEPQGRDEDFCRSFAGPHLAGGVKPKPPPFPLREQHGGS